MSQSAPIFVTIGWDREADTIRAFEAAVGVRDGLRETGREAYLVTLDRGLDCLIRERRRGVAFPVEEELDGSPIGVRERLGEAGIPVVGNPLAAVRRAADKWGAKSLLAGAGLAVPGAVLFRDPSDPPPVSWPRVVKPRVGRGGSIGVHYVEDAAALRALAGAGESGDPRLEGIAPGSELLLEEYVRGDEYSVWVFGPEPRPQDLVVIPVVRDDRPILDREAKVRKSFLPSEDVGRPEPTSQEISAEVRDAVQRAAAAAHRAIGADAYSRVDMIVRDDTPFVLEVNAAPRVAEEGALSVVTGQPFSFPAFLAEQVDAAMKRAERGE
jgi:D-alanine-D-alanine ligase